MYTFSAALTKVFNYNRERPSLECEPVFRSVAESTLFSQSSPCSLELPARVGFSLLCDNLKPFVLLYLSVNVWVPPGTELQNTHTHSPQRRSFTPVNLTFSKEIQHVITVINLHRHTVQQRNLHAFRFRYVTFAVFLMNVFL